MKRYLLLPALCLTLAVGYGCDDDAVSGPSPRGADARPEVGTQVDRTGRPAISTALIGAFAASDDKAAKKNAYNASSDPATWDASFAAEIEGNLAIYDALNVTCGDQLIADADPNDRYAFLAGALADDQLYVNSTMGTATCVFLGVEGEVAGAVPAGGGGCGGRRLTDDVIERYYSVLAIGALTGVDDGITADDKGFSNSFPFLSAP